MAPARTRSDVPSGPGRRASGAAWAGGRGPDRIRTGIRPWCGMSRASSPGVRRRRNSARPRRARVTQPTSRSAMLTRFSRVSIRLRLLLGFGVVIAVFVIAMGASLVLSASAETAWEDTARWDRATEGAAAQITGTQDQMRAQSMAVATMDTRYIADFDAALTRTEAASEAVAAIGDPVIADIARRAFSADQAHDAGVTRVVFPAVIAGDRGRAAAGLGKADENVRRIRQ